MLNSLKQYGPRETAMACLFLAGKVEESLRKVEAVVNYLLRLEDRRKGKEPDVHPSNEVGPAIVTVRVQANDDALCTSYVRLTELPEARETGAISRGSRPYGPAI